METPNRYMTPPETVEHLRLPSLKALYGLVARKQIPYIRLGSRLLRFDRVALECWLARRAVKVKEVRRATAAEDATAA